MSLMQMYTIVMFVVLVAIVVLNWRALNIGKSDRWENPAKYLD